MYLDPSPVNKLQIVIKCFRLSMTKDLPVFGPFYNLAIYDFDELETLNRFDENQAGACKMKLAVMVNKHLRFTPKVCKYLHSTC